MTARIVILACLALTGSVGAQTTGFWLTGYAGTQGGGVNALSANGQVAAGGSGGIGFTWSQQGGRFDFGLLPGMPERSPAYALSGDGTVLAGQFSTSPAFPEPTHAYRWTGSGALQDLGFLTNETRAHARGISGDGSVVVGWCEHTQTAGAFCQAFRWTEQNGMQPLGYTRPNGTFAQARAISRDGTTIVGNSQSLGPFGPVDAFAWTQAGGMQALPSLPGTSEPGAFANAVNANGAVIVGLGTSAQTATSTAVRWASGMAQDLGTVPGFLRSVAFAVDDTGNFVGGQVTALSSGPPDSAFVWTPTTGMLLLSDYLSQHGIGIPAGYRLQNLLAISGDGLTFAGFATNIATSTPEGFVATVPPPPSILVLLLPALAPRRRRTH